MAYGQSAQGQSAEEFYKGRTIQMAVGYEVGNDYDIGARLLARHLTKDLRRPLEKPAPPGRLTPARVRRWFRHLRQTTTRPARAPKPSRPGPGRPKGSKNKTPAPRPEVGKTIKRDTSLKERRERTG